MPRFIPVDTANQCCIESQILSALLTTAAALGRASMLRVRACSRLIVPPSVPLHTYTLPLPLPPFRDPPCFVSSRHPPPTLYSLSYTPPPLYFVLSRQHRVYVKPVPATLNDLDYFFEKKLQNTSAVSFRILGSILTIGSCVTHLRPLVIHGYSRVQSLP